METIRLVLLVSLIAAMTAACASTGASPSPTMTTTTLMSGWEQHFSIEWAADQGGQNGARRVIGYIYTRRGEPAEDVRLLAQALDSSGAVIGQHIAFLPGGVVGGHTYFEVPNLPAASSYRVSVWDYSVVNGKEKR